MWSLIELEDKIVELETKLSDATQVLESIANERLELSHDKIKWQAEDHIRWCKQCVERINKQ